MANGRQSFWYSENSFRYHVVPPVFLLFFPSVVQVLVLLARGEELSLSRVWSNGWGDTTSWTWVLVISAWAFASLKVPSKIVLGPETPFGYRPPYKDNGFQYYCVTLAVFLAASWISPQIPFSLYDHFPQLLGSFNIIALLLCTVLLLKGKVLPDHPNDPLEDRPVLYEFYRGVELHPRLLSVDVKQLTNCRIGLMAWQIFVTAFFFTGLWRQGFNAGSFVDFALQTIYIAKFFWWEAGYFYTLDMMLDRSGFYICWGCLVWVPCLYTYSSNYIVAHPPALSTAAATAIFVLGVVSILLNYRVDHEKQLFRNSNNYKCNIWGKPAEFVLAEYKDSNGKLRKSGLLTSGFWGIGRHVNYTFELSAAFSWCAVGGLGAPGGLSLWPLLYFIFLFGLLAHRTIRDEDKCRKKYGKHWEEYCRQVPYRLIPYVW